MTHLLDDRLCDDDVVERGHGAAAAVLEQVDLVERDVCVDDEPAEAEASGAGGDARAASAAAAAARGNGGVRGDGGAERRHAAGGERLSAEQAALEVVARVALRHDALHLSCNVTDYHPFMEWNVCVRVRSRRERRLQAR